MKNRWLLGLLAVLLLTGCGVRIDTAPPTPAPPSQAEQARQRAAQALQTIANYDGELATAQRAALVTNAAAQAAALGGVWQDCRTSPQCATKSASEFAPPSESELDSLGTTAHDALKELADEDNELGRLAAAMLPQLRSELGVENPRSYNQRDWTDHGPLLEALAWGVWQLDAATARTPEANLGELTAELRAAQAQCAQTLRTIKVPAFRTLDEPALTLLDELGRRIGAQLVNLPVDQRPAAIDLLQRINDEIVMRGGTLPASWLEDAQ